MNEDDGPNITVSVLQGGVTVHVDSNDTEEIVEALHQVITMLLDAEGTHGLH